MAEGNKLCGREQEVEFVTHVTYGGSVKFFRQWYKFLQKQRGLLCEWGRKSHFYPNFVFKTVGILLISSFITQKCLNCYIWCIYAVTAKKLSQIMHFAVKTFSLKIWVCRFLTTSMFAESDKVFAIRYLRFAQPCLPRATKPFPTLEH